jgi:hypothetical protein
VFLPNLKYFYYFLFFFQGHAIPCPSDDVVCGQDISGVSYYGDVLVQLALVRDTILTPRYLHTACPNPSRNTIEKQTCGWYTKTRGASCVDSVFQGNFFNITFTHLMTTLGKKNSKVSHKETLAVLFFLKFFCQLKNDSKNVKKKVSA